MRPIATPDGMLATQSFGQPNRGTILLVMGATASMVSWPEGFCRRLAGAGYRVIRFDHRDTGLSTTRPLGAIDYDVGDMVGDLTAIMDEYDIAACHIVGMSLGALLGQMLALQQPQRVLSLTLISAEPLGLPYEGEGISDAFMAYFGGMATLDWSDEESVSAFLLGIAELSAGGALPFDRAAVLTEITMALSRSADLSTAFNHSMLKGEIDPALTAGAITRPSLIIHGSADPVISVNAAKANAAAIAGSRLVVLEGRGHELAPADHHSIADEIIRFVSDHS